MQMLLQPRLIKNLHKLTGNLDRLQRAYAYTPDTSYQTYALHQSGNRVPLPVPVTSDVGPAQDKLSKSICRKNLYLSEYLLFIHTSCITSDKRDYAVTAPKITPLLYLDKRPALSGKLFHYIFIDKVKVSKFIKPLFFIEQGIYALFFGLPENSKNLLLLKKRFAFGVCSASGQVYLFI